ncbi:Uncharacterised protein [uncultured archaeon]|nr:Uncharacterised protein [uncultured archaeon]
MTKRTEKGMLKLSRRSRQRLAKSVAKLKDPRTCAEYLETIEKHFDARWAGDSDTLSTDLMRELQSNSGNSELFQIAMFPLRMVIKQLENPDTDVCTASECARLRVLYLTLRRCAEDIEKAAAWLDTCREMEWHTSHLDAKGRKRLTDLRINFSQEASHDDQEAGALREGVN